MKPRSQLWIIGCATFAPVFVLIVYVWSSLKSSTPPEITQMTQMFPSVLATMLAVLVAGCYVFTTLRVDIQAQQIAEKIAKKTAKKKAVKEAREQTVAVKQEIEEGLKNARVDIEEEIGEISNKISKLEIDLDAEIRKLRIDCKLDIGKSD